MKPEFQSKRLLSITRAREKMYEFGLSKEAQFQLGEGEINNPASLFILTIGILGDYAVAQCDGLVNDPELADGIQFAARFFDAYLGSRFDGALPQDVLLFASSAYYLAGRPGSSLVLARKMASFDGQDDVEVLLQWILRADWSVLPEFHAFLWEDLHDAATKLSSHFNHGGVSADEVLHEFNILRERIYASGSPRELLFIDVCTAVASLRLRASAWKLLPEFTGLPVEQWSRPIQRAGFPKELWPSQILLGEHEIFRGSSGIVQMPTSAGKTKSLEIILRASFLAGRARLAVVVVPFRALSHEVGESLSSAFKSDDIKVNELTDAIQLDFMAQIEELLGQNLVSTRYVLVVTPEKLLYVLRQQPELAKHIGLLAYDEAHQFDSGPRGILYELLLTEIKSLVPQGSQTLLISAVIKNAHSVASWLIGADAKVADGTSLLPTARSVAFASWAERLGQLMFFDSGAYNRPDFFLPRVIEQYTFDRKKGESTVKKFPIKGPESSKDVSLYLGISVASQGTVAIFCGLKATADSMIKRVVEVYGRGFNKPAPAQDSDQEELQKMQFLIGQHFGSGSDLYKAAGLGVFLHHGNTPQGIRLALEYAMQTEKLRFVICTSTLAQGVNLPIRYLIVSSVYQAGDRIKTRDFLNLIGRAGRAGMHTEGLVIFADPTVLDERANDGWKFDMSVNLLKAEKSEDTSSSLLELITPLTNELGNRSLPMLPTVLTTLLLGTDAYIANWATGVERAHPGQRYTAKDLTKQVEYKKRLLVSVESYLMSNRGADTTEQFSQRAVQLATSTLAYSLASSEQRTELEELFRAVALHVEHLVPAQGKQVTYSKTLLGAEAARTVETWVEQNRDELLALQSNDEWLSYTWKLFQTLSKDNFFHAVAPPEFPITLARRWVGGASYADLISLAQSMNATKPWGDTKRRKVASIDVMNFVEGTLAFDCPLILAAIAQFLFGRTAATDESARPLARFQKCLKYGVPDRLSISAFEEGFADRVLAQAISTTLKDRGYEEEIFRSALPTHKQILNHLVAQFPSYYGRRLSEM
jgi:superfamily II DNA/RNA helicase